MTYCFCFQCIRCGCGIWQAHHQDEREVEPSWRRYVERIKDPEFMTGGEVARIFFVDAKTVARWAKSGKLPSTRTLGGHRRYRKADVVKLLEQPGDPSPAAPEAEVPDPMKDVEQALWKD
jgi:excisionase family DNA binding protein